MLTIRELDMMASNFERRAEQFDLMAERDREYSAGADKFRRLAQDCRREIHNRETSHAGN